MGDWDPFGAFHALLVVALIDGVAAVNGALASYVLVPLRAAVVLTFMVSCLAGMLNPGWGSLSSALGKLFVGLVAVTLLAEASVFGETLRLVMLRTPPEIAQALAGAMGTRPVTASLWWDLTQKIWASGLAALKALPTYSFVSPILAIGIVFYWAFGICAVCLGWFLWERSFGYLALLTAVWPVFLPLFAFERTRGWAQGWANTAMACAVFQFMAAALVALLMTVLTQVLGVIVAKADAGKELSSLLYVFISLCVLVGAGWLMWDLNGMAGTIAHGFPGNAMSIARGIAGRRGRGGGGGGARATSAGAAAGSAGSAPLVVHMAAPRRVFTPPPAQPARSP